MDVFIQWIMQIIVFILLAIIVELFVPTSKMAKYVRLIIGLIFLLILMKPVLYLFQIDMEKRVFEQLLDPISVDEQQRLQEEVRQQHERLQTKTNTYLLTEVTERLKTEAENVLAEHEVDIHKIDYQFADQSMDFNQLTQMIVYIIPREEVSDDLVVIDEVIIRIDEETDQEDEEDLLIVKEALEEVWQVDEDELIVKWGK